MKLSSITRSTKTFTMEFDGESLEVTYRPGALTDALSDEYDKREEAAKTSEEKGAALAYFLSQVLVEWDVQDDHGKKIAPTEKFIATLPPRFRWRVFNAIYEDLYPKARNDAPSGGSFSPAEKS